LKVSARDIEGPIRGELFSTEKLEEYASYLATELKIGDPPKTGPTPLHRMRENGAKVLGAYRILNGAMQKKEYISPGAEWVVDNFHIVEDQIREIIQDLSPKFYKGLPKLASGDLTGVPRVYAIALALVAHTDSRLDSENIRRFIDAFQKITPLRIGELWALIITLRLALLENLRRLTLRIVFDREKRTQANALADLLAKNVGNAEHFKALTKTIPTACKGTIDLESAYIAQLAKRLRDQENEHWPAIESLEKHLTEKCSSTELAVRLDHQRQAANQVTVANVITSMRLLSSLDWKPFLEKVLLVDRILETDPEGSYSRMDFLTRDRYRHVIERISKKASASELDVARKVVELAEAAKAATPEDLRRSHVGYYLVDQGVRITEKCFQCSPSEKLSHVDLSRAVLFYFGLAGISFLIPYLFLLIYSARLGTPSSGLIGIAFLTLVPISDLALGIANFILTHSIRPHRLPKMDLKGGVPTKGRTMIVIPSLLSSFATIQELLEKIEIHYLGNSDPEFFFALLTDFRDSETEFSPDDNKLLQAAHEGIHRLNQKYSSNPEAEAVPNRFFIFHRRRQWNSYENIWMGWERKRGKIQEFNRLLRNSADTSFAPVNTTLGFLPSFRFVITLDADTQLPRDAARKMVGTAMHPLNQAHFDPESGRVTKGYGVFQPRIGISLESSTQSRFAKLFSSPIGIDPYTTAVSDVYQDLFSEGNYTGKGLYDVDAFEASLKDRVPLNTILSHDLFEGLYARTALVTDVEFYDDYPKTYDCSIHRQHRWIRGDWQIAPWLLPLVPDATHRWVRNQLPFVARWKIFDNLRRSLVAPTLFIWYLLAFTVLPGSPLVWVGTAFLLTISPCFSYAASRVITRRWGDRRTAFSTQWDETTVILSHAFLSLVFLAHQAVIQLDAICRALYRSLISKVKRLEWTTAAQVGSEDQPRLNLIWQSVWPTEVFLAGMATLTFYVNAHSPENGRLIFLSLFFLWMTYPGVAAYLGRPLKKKHDSLNEEDRQLLRNIARRTWNYYETFVGPQDHFLPPDNYQDDPKPVIAHRTSPTNIGLYGLSLTAAHDLGYLDISELIRRLGTTIGTLEKLERYEGHFLNWYDTETLLPLLPRYVSTVDSGNLAGFLLTVKQACLEAPSQCLIARARINGLKDTLSVLREELNESKKISEPPSEIARCEKILSHGTTNLFSDWASLISELNLPLEELRQRVASAPEPHSHSPEILNWLGSMIERIRSDREDLNVFAPWTVPGFTEIKPAALPDAEWRRLLHHLDQNQELSAVLESYDSAILILENTKGDSLEFLDDLKRARTAIRGLGRNSLAYATQIERLFEEMNFKFLLNGERQVFSIGFNVSENKQDGALYDLLASESRLASFIAIAKGDVPQEHWFKLGKQLVPAKGGRALVSWSASMFEYLMPLVVMKNFANTLLEETYHAVVAKQIDYGKKRKVPWGVSEAGYNARDLQLTYQYGPFGIPGLGVKHGLSHDLVISPYSTLLAALIRPSAAIANLKRLIGMGFLTKYGFYEAIDYTPERVPEGQEFAVVKSVMSHHQGMSLVAIDNVINHEIMQDRFHREPRVRATKLLLQERIPRNVVTALPKTAEVELEGDPTVPLSPCARHYHDPGISPPRVQLLSNGNYSVMISTAGSGYSKFENQAVTRWREDATRDHWGSFIFIKDVAHSLVWSTGYQPITQTTPTSFRASFNEEKIEFLRKDGDISSHTEIIVASEDNVEIRQVTLTNHSPEPRMMEITSYLEPVLAPFASDSDHPAFSKLFIQTEFLSSRNALIAHRRKRSDGDREFWGLHVVVGDQPFSSEVQYETDRERFIGRGQELSNAAALFGPGNLSSAVSDSLDPVLSLRVHLELAPGATARVAFTTGVAPSREGALDLADRYHDIHAFERESKLAWTKSQADLSHLNIDAETASLFQRLAERILYSDPSLRPPSHHLGMNAPLKYSLWPYGISGDLPIIALAISDPRDSANFRKLLRCHEYLRMKGLAYDFVVFSEHGTTYLQELQSELQRQIRITGSQGLISQPGGIHILRSDITPELHRSHILAVARVSFFADHSLHDQINRELPKEEVLPLLAPRLEKPNYPKQDLPVPSLDFFNGFGGFAPGGKEYVIVLGNGQWTPAPWINVIGNQKGFGFQMSETGSGFTWSMNSQANRLTPWSNDPVSDPPGEIIYLRDDETGEVWNPTPLPIRGESNTIVRHGLGYTSFEHVSHGIHHSLTSFVPKDDSVKISLLKLKNRTTKKRVISITSYTEWVLGSRREESASHLVYTSDPECAAIFARNPSSDEFHSRVAFSDISETRRAFTCSRREFLGPNGNYSEPASLKRVGLSGREGTSEDPCAVLQTRIELQPGEERELTILLGQCETIEMARELTLRYRNLELARKALQEVTDDWNRLVNAVQVKTPDPTMDTMMNGWLLYQTLSCRFWSRTAFYQSGGAFGFRDQLQDCMAFVYSAPHLTREHLLLAASRQFKEGDVQHWWHPPSGRGIRTRISDDLLWLPFAVSHYIKITGDRAILSESVSFLDAPLLKSDQDDSFTVPKISPSSATLYEHCIRAIDHALPLGAHGLPLIGSGDWNDGMNRVGQGGKGESVWLGWFLYKVIEDFLPFCDDFEADDKREEYTTHLEKLKRALNSDGWDGEWYRRAYFDDGTPLGSAANEECKIDGIAQTWSVLSGAGEPAKAALAMKMMRRLLVRKESKIVLVLTPPFDKSTIDPGYIKGYLPGVRENGGQYTHAATWGIIASAETGDGDAAFELFSMLNPLNHSRTQPEAERYKLEPYVISGDVYSGAPYEGRGGWSWYTGSAAWYYRAGLESILGLRLRGSKLRFKPCIPKSWKSYEMIYTYENTKYFIRVENPSGVMQGETRVELDGSSVPDAEINLVDDSKDHQIRVVLALSAERSREAPEAPGPGV
jgi:cyclic beta-1,2-glucan synthetase